MKVFAQVILSIGLVLLAISGVMYLINAVFISRAELVDGTVTLINTSFDSDYNSTTYCPLVRYTTKAGQTLTYDSEVCSSPANYKVGDQVQIYYDPQDPGKAQIKNFWSQYLQSITMSGLGLPFVGLGALLLISSRRRKPTAAA